jgi:hypothetical protein
MAALRILVPVKRVIDYAVCSSFSASIGEGRGEGREEGERKGEWGERKGEGRKANDMRIG